MIVFLLILAVIAIACATWAYRIWRSWPRDDITFSEPTPEPFDFRPVQGNVYRMKLPDRFKLEMRRER